MIARAQTIKTPPRRRPKQRPCNEQIFTSFPNQYFEIRSIRGVEILFRSICPEDELLLLEFHKTLSDQSVHFRYFGAVTLRERTLHERLRRHCVIDHAREFAVVAEGVDKTNGHQILGVARLFKNPARDEAEFAILINDQWQGTGLGTYLLELLVRVGRESRLRRIIGHILADNAAMVRVSRKAGFSLRHSEGESEWLAEIIL